MANTTIPQLTINMDRLRKDLLDLADIGKNPEDQGIYRMAFTAADMEAREWLKDKINDAGLEVSQDGAANIYGHLNMDDSKPLVMMGSHIDTVPGAGHLDGSLGVLVALESLRRMKEEGIKTNYPLEMVSFTDEEGRFGGLFGSQSVVGDVNPDTIHSATDLQGIKLTDAMAQHGLNAMDALDARRHPDRVHSYLELHIEQGPVLDEKGYSFGIVTEITGLFKWAIRLIGEADHAGTTPLPMRKDAFLGLAEFSSELYRVLEEYGTENSVATIGRVDMYPGTANTVPGRVDFSLDVRDTNPEVLTQLSDAYRRALSAIARRRRLMFEFDILSEVEPQQCDAGLVDTLTKTAEALNLEPYHMPSGAAHDAQIMAKLTKVGMIFVPSKGGRSHSPAEWTHWEDIEIGANLALNSLMHVAEIKN